MLATRGGRTVIPNLQLLLLLRPLLLLLLLLLATYSAGVRGGPVSDAESLRAFPFVNGTGCLPRNTTSSRCSEIPESSYGSETDAARAAPFRRVRTRPTGSAGCGCTRGRFQLQGRSTGTGAS